MSDLERMRRQLQAGQRVNAEDIREVVAELEQARSRIRELEAMLTETSKAAAIEALELIPPPVDSQKVLQQHWQCDR